MAVDVYPKKIVSHDIAMTINGKGTYASVYRKDWEALFSQLHLNPTGMMKEMAKTFSGIVEKGYNLANKLNENPLTASDVYDKISANIKDRYQTLFE